MVSLKKGAMNMKSSSVGMLYYDPLNPSLTLYTGDHAREMACFKLYSWFNRRNEL